MNEAPWWMWLCFALILILLCGGVGSCKKWQYDECIKVGHGKTYCTAQAAGCFGGGRRQ